MFSINPDPYTTYFTQQRKTVVFVGYSFLFTCQIGIDSVTKPL